MQQIAGDNGRLREERRIGEKGVAAMAATPIGHFEQLPFLFFVANAAAAAATTSEWMGDERTVH